MKIQNYIELSVGSHCAKCSPIFIYSMNCNDIIQYRWQVQLDFYSRINNNKNICSYKLITIYLRELLKRERVNIVESQITTITIKRNTMLDFDNYQSHIMRIY